MAEAARTFQSAIGNRQSRNLLCMRSGRRAGLHEMLAHFLFSHNCRDWGGGRFLTFSTLLPTSQLPGDHRKAMCLFRVRADGVSCPSR